MNLKFKIGDEQYDEVVNAIYLRFVAHFEFDLLNSKDQLLAAEEQQVFWKKLLIDKLNGDTKTQAFSSLLNIQSSNLENVQFYIDCLLEDKENEILKSISVQEKIVLGTLKGLLFFLDNINKTVTSIKTSGNISIPIPVIGKETILKFKTMLDDLKTKFYDWLMIGYNNAIIDVVSISKFRTELEYAYNELDILNRLVRGEQRTDDNLYLLKRLKISDDQLQDILKAGVQIRAGGYIDILSSYNIEEQKCAAKFLAIKDFIDYLTNRVAELQFKDKSSNATEKTTEGITISSFHWIDLKIREPKLKLLYLLMTQESMFIHSDTDSEIFLKAFSGVTLTAPLNIKWMILTKDRRNTSKSSLFYFLNKLIENKFITHPATNKGFCDVIERVFADKDGKQLKNLEVSLSDSKTTGKPMMAEEIDKLILELNRKS